MLQKTKGAMVAKLPRQPGFPSQDDNNMHHIIYVREGVLAVA